MGQWASSSLLALALLLGVPPAARADEPARGDDAARVEHPPSEGAPPEALSHYKLGREHFRAGRYDKAIVELKAALALDPTSPNLTYNVAYTSELLGNLSDAIDYYRKYLIALPKSEATERDKIEVTLRRLEGRLAEQPATTNQTNVPPARGLGRADVWFWASLGGGAALLGGGAVTGLLALQREHEVKTFVAGKNGTLADRQALIDETHHLALACDITTAAGAAFVVTAALLFFLREPKSEPAREPPRASIATDGRNAIFLLGGSF
jgi:tetratricopeptide (TPR) repeat protein